MKRMFALCMIVLLAVAGCTYAKEQRRTAEEAEAMLDKAIAYYVSNDPKKAFAAFNDPREEFVDGDLFIFALDMHGTILAHGGKPALVGKGPDDIRDADEKNCITELMEAAKTKQSGTVDYKFENPASLMVEKKSSFFQEVGGIVLGSGYFTAYEWQVFPHPFSM